MSPHAHQGIQASLELRTCQGHTAVVAWHPRELWKDALGTVIPEALYDGACRSDSDIRWLSHVPSNLDREGSNS